MTEDDAEIQSQLMMYFEDALRARLGYSMRQASLGQRLGLSQAQYSKARNGRRKVSVAEFIRWCEILELRPWEVMRPPMAG